MRALGAVAQLSTDCLGGLPCRYRNLGHVHSAVIVGPSQLSGVESLRVPDLRAGLAYVIAAAVAQGETRVYGVDMIERGYGDIVPRLQAMGLRISRGRRDGLGLHTPAHSERSAMNRRAFGDLALVLLLGLAGYALALGLPVGALRHAVPGDLGDTRLAHYLMEHSGRWLAGDPLHTDLWRLPTFHPSPERTFLFSEILLAVAPPYWALRALGAGATDAYVGWLLVTSLLNVAAGFVCLRHGFGQSRAASHVGATS